MTSTFSWYDLMTTNPEAALGFYARVLGWGTMAWDGPMPYTMFTRGGSPFGGVMTLPEEARKMGAPPHWLGYVSVTDLDATVAKVREQGGRVYREPTPIPGVGGFAVLGDPMGAVFAIVRNDNPGGGPVGAVSWSELMTDDIDRAMAFYGPVFGWTRGQAMDMGADGVYQMFQAGETVVGGMMRRPPMVPMCAWGFYMEVADVAGTIAAVTREGGKALHGPAEVPGGRLIANLLDGQGAAFGIYGPKPA